MFSAMSTQVSLAAGVLVFKHWVQNGVEHAIVRDIARKRSVRLAEFDDCDPMAISHDGERIAFLRGKRWQRQPNEVVVVAWRKGETICRKTGEPHLSAVFDLSGALLLVTVEKATGVCVDVATGTVVARTTRKLETVLPHHFDAARNAVWLPPAGRRSASRLLFDFATRSEKPAPAVVDAVSPDGALYRLDTHLTRLNEQFEPMWSVRASRPGMDFELAPTPIFPGSEDALVHDEPDPQDRVWGFWVARNAATGKELARRKAASGESPEVGWPGRYLVQPKESLLWSVDTLKTKHVDVLPTQSVVPS